MRKQVRLTPENHEFLQNLAFANKSSIVFETNQIISNERKLEEVKIYITKKT